MCWKSNTYIGTYRGVTDIIIFLNNHSKPVQGSMIAGDFKTVYLFCDSKAISIAHFLTVKDTNENIRNEVVDADRGGGGCSWAMDCY